MSASTRAIGQEIIPPRVRQRPTPALPPKRPLNPVTKHIPQPPSNSNSNPIPISRNHAQDAKPAPRQAAQPHPLSKHYKPTIRTKNKKRSLGIFRALQAPLIIILGALLGIFVQSAIVGQSIVLLYGAAALIWRIESRTTFTIAVITIAITVVLLFTQNSTMMAHNFASYSFMLLLVGIICMSREMREQKLLLVKKRGPERFKQYLKNRKKLQKAQRV